MKINDGQSYDKIKKSSYFSSDSSKVSEKVSSEKISLPKQGELIKGEIIDLNQSTVTIRLSNGQTVEAKMTDPFEFFIGQELSFVVKESSGPLLLLKPILEQEATVQNKLIQVLENANLSVTKTNLDLVAKLIEHQMPIDKETLQQVISYARQFNSADVDGLLFLMKNKMPVTTDNLLQLEKMTQGDNKVIQNLATLSDDLSLHIKQTDIQEVAKVLLKDNVLSQVAFDQVCKLVRQQEQQGMEQVQQKGQQQGLEQVQQKAQQQGQQKIQQDVQELVQHEVSDKVHANQILTSAERNIPLKAVMLEQEIQQMEIEINKVLEASTKGDTHLVGKNNLSFENKTIVELFNQINELDLPFELKDKLSNLLAQKITYSLFSKEVLMSKAHLESPEKLNEFYNQLHDKVVTLLDLEASVEGKASNLAKEAHQVKSAIEFMSDLNQKYNFIQLPMMLNDRLMNGELYVFNNKRQVKNDKASITALIRLDLLNLGHLDIYVSKKEQNLTIHFYTESQEKNILIDQKLHTIHNQLTNQGFKVQGISTKKKEKDFDVTDDFLQKKEEIHEVKRYTFDMRA